MSLLRRRMLIANASKGKSPVYDFPETREYYGEYWDLVGNLWSASDYSLDSLFFIPQNINIMLCGERAYLCRMTGTEGDPVAIVDSDGYRAEIAWFNVKVTVK